jgi:hypothetical protein
VPARRDAPRGLHFAPELEDGQVLCQQSELLHADAGRLVRLGRCSEPGKAQIPRAACVPWAGLWRLLLLLFGFIGFDLTGRQQLRQPLQFPARPRAPFASR